MWAPVRLLAKLVNLGVELFLAGILVYFVALFGIEDFQQGNYISVFETWLLVLAGLALALWRRHRSMNRTNTPWMRKMAYDVGVWTGRLTARLFEW